eukprot:363128-Chlamydomonas_euryale.AAC.3
MAVRRLPTKLREVTETPAAGHCPRMCLHLSAFLHSAERSCSASKGLTSTALQALQRLSGCTCCAAAVGAYMLCSGCLGLHALQLLSGLTCSATAKAHIPVAADRPAVPLSGPLPCRGCVVA